MLGRDMMNSLFSLQGGTEGNFLTFSWSLLYRFFPPCSLLVWQNCNSLLYGGNIHVDNLSDSSNFVEKISYNFIVTETID